MAADARLKPHWFYILLTLSQGDRHGLAIARDVESLSGGRVRLWPATLYGSLDALRSRRWIEELDEVPETESERKRYYRLTRVGRQILTEEAAHLDRVARLARGRTRPRTEQG
jgi:DNA-binding PadR family transcriptional regulator